MTVFLIVGLPGAGKTTRARELEISEGALRLTPDEWQLEIFHDDDPGRWRSPERAAHRDRIEGMLIPVGMRAASLGLEVVLDFGLWSRDERSALRWMARELGVGSQVVYLPIDYPEQRARVTGRYATGRQFEMSDDELAGWHTLFQAPDADELDGTEIPAVPQGFGSWYDWARARWPSLPEGGLVRTGRGA